MTAQQADQIFTPLEQNHSFDATASFVKQVARGCALSDAVPFATTANTARDMDVIRRQLGEDKINYFAWSRSPDQYRAEYQSDMEIYPMFGALGSNIFSCAYRATAPFEPPVQITSNGPHNILMLQNLRDPNTPHVGAREMRSALGQRAVMVSVDEGGHANLGFETNSCVNAAAVAYLGSGTLPADDTSCAAEASAATPVATTPERLRTLKQAAREISGLPRGH